MWFVLSYTAPLDAFLRIFNTYYASLILVTTFYSSLRLWLYELEKLVHTMFRFCKTVAFKSIGKSCVITIIL